MSEKRWMSPSKWNLNWSLNQSEVFKIALNTVTEYYRGVTKQLFIENNVDGNSILELGCGSGQETFWLMDRLGYKKATLVDFSKKALENVDANKGDLNVRLIYQNILNLTLREKFDMVHSGFVIEHFYGNDRLKVIKKHAEFVKNDGYVFIQAPGRTYLSLLYSNTINRFNGIEELLYSKKELLYLIDKADLTIKDKKELFSGAVYFYLLQKDRQ